LLDGTGGEIEPDKKSSSDVKLLVSELENQTETLALEMTKLSEQLRAVNRQLSALRHSDW